MLPGFPQDNSPAGIASPLKGFDATADPTVRAGSNGLFYVSGVAFNRADESPTAAAGAEGKAGVQFTAVYKDDQDDKMPRYHPNHRRRQGLERAFSRQVLERSRHSAWPGQLHGVEAGRWD